MPYLTENMQCRVACNDNRRGCGASGKLRKNDDSWTLMSDHECNEDVTFNESDIGWFDSFKEEDGTIVKRIQLIN